LFGQRLDVALLRNRDVAVSQDELDRFVIHSQIVQVGCQTTPGSMPATPFWRAFVANVFVIHFRDDGSDLALAHKAQRFSTGLIPRFETL
jgi:hypothetical protein